MDRRTGVGHARRRVAKVGVEAIRKVVRHENLSTKRFDEQVAVVFANHVEICRAEEFSDDRGGIHRTNGRGGGDIDHEE